MGRPPRQENGIHRRMPHLSRWQERRGKQMTIKSGFRHAWLVFLIFLFGIQVVHAVPETVSTRVTDVTPSSFSVVWMTNVPAEPDVEVYADQTMSMRMTDRKSTR